MAEKTPDERRKHTLVVVAIVGGGAAVLLVMVKGGVAAPTGQAPRRAATSPAAGAARSPHSLNFGPNPQQGQLDESIIAAREAALNTYDQSAVAELSTRAQYELGLNQDTTAQAINANNNATQLKETGMTTAADQAIAQAEATAQEQAAQAQASAYEQVGSQQAQAQQTQAQGGLWSSILGGIGSIIPFLGGL